MSTTALLGLLLEETALDRGQTDRISLTHDLDLDLQSPASYGHDLLACKSSRSTVDGSEESGNKRTDRRMEAIGICITSHVEAVGNDAYNNCRAQRPKSESLFFLDHACTASRDFPKEQ